MRDVGKQVRERGGLLLEELAEEEIHRRGGVGRRRVSGGGHDLGMGRKGIEEKGRRRGSRRTREKSEETDSKHLPCNVVGRDSDEIDQPIWFWWGRCFAYYVMFIVLYILLLLFFIFFKVVVLSVIIVVVHFELCWG